MELQTTFTKESIKNRMFKRAAALWDIRNIDHLDPIVKLMIEALSSEIFQLSREVNDVENRVLEKVARALTPSSSLSVQPAHAIMHANAVHNSCDILQNYEFHYKNAHFMKRHKLKRLSFTPIYSTRVFNGDVAYLAGSEGISSVDIKLGKELEFAATKKDPITNKSLWIGLDLAPEVISLENISFYFDFPYMDECEEYFRLLPHVKWEIEGFPLQSETGMYILNDEDENLASKFIKAYNTNNQISSDILTNYNHRFIHITERTRLKPNFRTLFPDEIKHLFTEETLAELTKPLVWVKLTFPSAFTSEALQGLNVQINAFPIANKFINTSERKVDEISGVIPLIKESNEYFLDIDNVSDVNGNQYHEQKYSMEHADTENHIYTLRRGGIERFNTANAREFLDHLVDLLRDESMAFSNVEKDTLGENANDLLRQLNQLESKISLRGSTAESTSYIVLNDKLYESTAFFIKYWLSNGIIGNGIKASEVLGFTDITDVNRTSTVMLTTSRGGKEAPDAKTLMEMYKFALTSHGAIYSKQDVKSFCAIYCGNNISNIEVKSGYGIGREPKQGIIRTIDVHLTPSAETSPQKLNNMKEGLLAALYEKSPQEFNYQLIVK